MSVKSSFKCIYCRNSRNKPGVFCHACYTSPPASHPDGERERQRQRVDEASLWSQTVYMWMQLVMRRQIAALKPDEREKERPYWKLKSVNQRKEKPLRAWPGKVPNTSPSVQNGQHCWTLFIDHPGRIFTDLPFPCSIWRIVVLSLGDRCVDNTVKSTEWALNSSPCLYNEDLRLLNYSHPIKKLIFFHTDIVMYS